MWSPLGPVELDGVPYAFLVQAYAPSFVIPHMSELSKSHARRRVTDCAGVVGKGVGALVTVGRADVGAGLGENLSMQIFHPERVTEPSVSHTMVVDVDTSRPSGPEVPSYSTPSIVNSSKPDSVEKLTTKSWPLAKGVIVQSSLLPWLAG